MVAFAYHFRANSFICKRVIVFEIPEHCLRFGLTRHRAVKRRVPRRVIPFMAFPAIARFEVASICAPDANAGVIGRQRADRECDRGNGAHASDQREKNTPHFHD